ncbi:MAG: hypothetical protein HFE77_01780 [Clostridiales bacterium]|nr:hypothetical protein [Clostridiales bacterium]
MNNLPYKNMTSAQMNQEMITQFLGYNHYLRPGEGEWFDMKNITSSDYPVFSPRRPRGEKQQIPRLQGMAGKDKLAYVADNKLYYDGKEIFDLVADRWQLMFATPTDWEEDCTRYFKDTEGTRVEPGTSFKADKFYKNPYYDTQRTLVSMGAYLVIFPDKRYINTVDFSDKGDLEAVVDFKESFMGDLPPTVFFSPCDQEGTVYEQKTFRLLTEEPDDWSENYKTKYYLWKGPTQGYCLYDDTIVWHPNVVYEKVELIGTEKPLHPMDGDIWIDTTTPENPVTRKYSSTMQMWTVVSSTYFKVESPGIGAPFRDGDTVTLFCYGDMDLNGDYNIVKADNDSFIVAGVLASFRKVDSGVIIKRVCPDMDFVIEGENRLWGCRYGISEKTGKFVNEIYACKLGDFKNWYTYAGVSTDAYAVSLGSDGAFTGAVFYAGSPTFFKERYVHRITGNIPANYCLYTTVCEGVQAGSGKSLAVVDGNLLYKSPTGVMTYTGGYPSSISSAFGDEIYYGAVAGEVNHKYYLSMRNEKGVYRLFVFDTAKGLWHIEDDIEVKGFARVSDVLYGWCDDNIFAMVGRCDESSERDVDWYAETGICGAVYPDQSFVSKIAVRASLPPGSHIEAYIEYDSDGKWQPVGSVAGTSFMSTSFSILPRRCDHYALRFEGVGDCKIYSITKTIEQGSDATW